MTLDTSSTIEKRWESSTHRQRDAWVASDVLGWTSIHGQTSEEPVTWLSGETVIESLPEFSTKEACTMVVLETIVREGWSYTIDGSDTHAEVNFLDGHIETFTTFKNTLAEALCVAALKLRASGIRPIRKGK